MRVDVFRILKCKKYGDGTCERRMIGLEDDIIEAKATICKDLFNKGIMPNDDMEKTSSDNGTVFSYVVKIDDPQYIFNEIRYYIIKDHYKEG